MIEGKNLWNAVDLVVRAGSEIEALVAELSKKMTGRLSKDGVDLGFICEVGQDEVLNATGDFVTVSLLSQWGLKPKGKGKRSFVGNLSATIVIWSEDSFQDPCGCIPRVEVAYMGSSEESTPDEMGAGTWLNNDDDWSEWGVSNDKKCLVPLKALSPNNGAKWNEKSDWIFVVPLFSLSSNEDIERLLIEPTIKLLRGEAPEDALSLVPAIEFGFSKEGLLCLHTQE